ncbi:hypothetical protein [Pseudooceanicola sp. MF1-13]|uniref:hypothetical protein n=1 Tax=Pseudooceanicola sp. MF1-13 TaxID=3379095 RepID=UPI003892A0F9
MEFASGLTLDLQRTRPLSQLRILAAGELGWRTTGGAEARVPDLQLSYRRDTGGADLAAKIRVQRTDLRRLTSFIDPVTGAALDRESPGHRLAYRAEVRARVGKDGPLEGSIGLVHAGRRFSGAAGYVGSDRTRVSVGVTGRHGRLAWTNRVTAERERADSQPALTSRRLDVTTGLEVELDQITRAKVAVGHTVLRQRGGFWGDQTGLHWSLSVTRDRKAGQVRASYQREIAPNGARDSLMFGGKSRTGIGAISARLGLMRDATVGGVFVGDLRYTRRLSQGRFEVRALRELRVQDGGAVQVVTEGSAKISHEVLRGGRITFDLGIADIRTLNRTVGARQRLRVGASYGVAVTSDWRLEGGIDHRVSRPGPFGRSTTLFVTLSRDVLSAQ